MDWPTKLDVVIEYDADRREDKHSTLIGHVKHYGWAYGPMARYETDDGEKFWLDGEYFLECKEKSLTPRIPIEVIKKDAAIQAKLAEGQRQLNQQKRQQDTGLILPDGYRV